MRKFKLLSLILVAITILNTILPVISVAVENCNQVLENEEIGENVTQNENITSDVLDEEIENNVTENEENNTETAENKLQENVVNNIIINESENDTESIINENSNQIIENIIEENIIQENIVEDDDIEENKIIEVPEEIQKVMAQQIEFSAYVKITEEYQIDAFEKDDIHYLFLPNTIDLANVEIYYNYGSKLIDAENSQIDLENKVITTNFSNQDTITITMEDKSEFTIKAMKSDIPSMHINLKDVNLATLNGGSKDTKYGASMQIVGAKEEYNLSDSNIEIKGRGNTTWNLKKKPYQIKLDKKQNLLGMGIGKSKKWILLANHLDRTLMRNKLIDDIQKEIGLTNTLNAEYIDLYINGEYCGNYLLCEKIEVGSARVNLEDSKGVICEMDRAYGTKEDYYFTTNITKMVFTLKESVSDVDESDELEEALAGFKDLENTVNKFESLIYAENPNWEEISKLIDVESFIKYYFITELAEDPDRFITSTFVYKDGPDDVLHMGAVWDNDTALGYHIPVLAGGSTTTDYNLNLKKYRTDSATWFMQLYRNKEFSIKLNKAYNNGIKDVFNTAVTKLTTYKSEMNKSAKMNFTRWDLLKTGALLTAHIPAVDYNGEVLLLKNWVQNRVKYLNSRYSTSIKITYTSNIRDLGYEDNWRKDGQTSGTIGNALPIEKIKIVLPNAKAEESIKYSLHVENYGWLNEVSDGNETGIDGSKIEAVKIWLEGMNDYKVMYRVHVSEVGWMDWVENGEIAGTTGRNLGIEAIEIKIESHQYLGTTEKEEGASVNYKAHIQSKGWSGWASDGELMGVLGQSKKIEAIIIDTGDNIQEENILTYRAHVQGIGWQDWKNQGEEAGTTGKNKRLEAIEIKVNDSVKYKLTYRVYVENNGWTEWKNSGEMAGTTGKALKIEAIEIKLQQRRFLGIETKDENSLITYTAHIKNIGWSGYGINNEIIGTMGENKRIEAINIELSSEIDGELTYRTHIAKYGWQEWCKSGEISGSTGQGLRVEAFQIKLENSTKYDIEYRAYVSNIGWMNWVKNGEIAGTTGNALQVEAMQIRVVEK